MNKKEQVEVTFYRFPNGKKGVVKGDENVPGAEVLHPTRITLEEWEAILSITTNRIDEVLSQYLKV